MTEPGKDLEERAPAPERRRLWLPFVSSALVASLALVAAILLGGTLLDPAQGFGGSPGAQLDAPALGDENAPVVMVEYADFQCGFCGEFAREVEPGVREKYVEGGTLRLEWRDFPYLGGRSVKAALAARAAQEQGKFWEYHDLLYEKQASLSSAGFSDEKLTDLAREAGLDMEQFEASFKGRKYQQTISNDFRESYQRRIIGTPTFFINDKMLIGAQPAEVLEDAIEQAARDAGPA